MHSLFKDKPDLMPVVQVAIIAFIALSIVNLCYSIRLNKALTAGLDKEA